MCATNVNVYFYLMFKPISMNSSIVSCCNINKLTYLFICGWLCSRVVSVLDSGAEGPGFKSQSLRYRVTVLGKLFTPIVLCSPNSEIGSSPLKRGGGKCRHGRK